MSPLTSSSTSASLIRQVRENDPQAWSRLARLYGPVVFGWCRQAGLPRDDVADVVQNVFTSVYKNIGRFRREEAQDSFRGWLWTISRNEVRLHFRRRAGQPHAAGGSAAQQVLQQIPECFEEPAVPADESCQRQIVHRALRLLQGDFTESTWQAFWRTAVDGQPGPQVAEELGMTPGAVRQAKCAVLQRLRQFLAED